YEKAVEAGIEPKAYVDEYAQKFDALKSSLNLSYTNFIQTSSESHKKAAQTFWMKCFENGDIYKDRYQVKYCVGCELEKTDSELVDGECEFHPGKELELRDEENYFFAFSKYQERLLKLYNERPDFVMPAHRQKEIRTFVEGGLKDFSISRLKEKMPWGVQVPNDDDHVMYVWFDALINYISTLGWPEAGKDFDTYWPGVQVAGKDNLRQQSAMWQAMLMSAGIENSKQVFIHGFITADGQKMSKSIGNVVDPFELVDEYGTEAVRYYLLREIPSNEDGDYSGERMEQRYAELANRLGNLVSRVAAMSNKYFAGELDDVTLDWSAQEAALEAAMKNYAFKKYFDVIFKVVDEANEAVESKQPFKLVKEDEVAAKKVLSEIAEQIRFIGRSLAPVLPQTSTAILERYGKVVATGDALFPRRD
ncbi:MAG: methionine--tRNA ligase, partial [bacterium]|nr:methionine--tRNA ligase [bacterium]